MKTFIIWVKLYCKHLYYAIDAILWGRKYGVKLTLTEIRSMLRWTSFKKYKSHALSMKAVDKIYMKVLTGAYNNLIKLPEGFNKEVQP